MKRKVILVVAPLDITCRTGGIVFPCPGARRQTWRARHAWSEGVIFLELLLLRLASARFAFISAHLNKKNRTICGSAGKSLFRCTSFSIVEVVLKGNISPLLAQCVSETATDGQIHKKKSVFFKGRFFYHKHNFIVNWQQCLLAIFKSSDKWWLIQFKLERSFFSRPSL